MATIRFGTDGWRAIIARDFTFDNVALCAQGVANYLRQEGLAERGLVVGYDTRFASLEFAQQVAEVLAGNGILTYLATKAAPTPAVTYNILDRKAAGAAIITASHNPAIWNGFKYKPEYAGSASPEITARLEEEIERAERDGVSSLPVEQGIEKGLVQRVDLEPPYLAHVAKIVDLSAISQAGLNIVVDDMHGAGSGYLTTLLSPSYAGGTTGANGKTAVLEIRSEPNPAFPGMQQPEPLAHNLSGLSNVIVDKGADVGIGLDGDADRVGVIDEHGRFLTTLQTFALLALYLLEIKGERGALVKALTSTSMVDRLGEVYDVPVFETPVGFKYVGPIMMRENALIGGEESGGYGFRGHIPERDGVFSALLILDYMAKTSKKPSQLIEHLYSIVGPHHYQRRDIHFPPEDRERLQSRLESGDLNEVAGMQVVGTDTMGGLRFRFGTGAWLLVRFSGTEPLLRIYAEAESPDQVEKLLDGAVAFLGL